ncbi:MAG: prolyl oligopeptidase [Pirellulaceae bacterium]|nr:MAG: prolyl oligopeptidase [Pirellulaceae bacterium]
MTIALALVGSRTMRWAVCGKSAVWLAMLVTGLLPGAVRAERMTPERLWQLGRLEGGTLSGDGRWVAYGVRRYDLAENRGWSELHLLRLEDGADRLVWDRLESLASVQWTLRDGRPQLLFLARRSGQEGPAQLFLLDPHEGEPRQLSNFSESVMHVKASPTGEHIAYVRRVKLDPTINELYPDLPKAEARLIDSLMFRHWDHWHDYSYSHVFVCPWLPDGSLGEEVDLMRALRADCPLPPFGGAEQYAWSPDGRELALTMKLVNNPAESTDGDIYLVRLESPEERRCITHGMDGYDMEPNYSPDGAWIAFHSMAEPGYESDRNRIMLFDRATGVIEELTAELDQTTHHAAWSSDSRSVWFESELRGTRQLFRIALGHREVRQITGGRHDWRLCGVSPDGRWLLAARQDMIRPEELYRVPVDGAPAEVLTHINDGMYEKLELPRVEERWVRASDGRPLHCWVVFPPDFDAQRTWPMLTYCQGGPQSQVSQFFSYRWNFHLMAAHGYVVLAPNRRGLPGFGQEWNDQITQDWGGQAMQDILAATDEMMAQSYIDRRRIAAVGASFGGYTVYWLMGNHQDRFCCMIAHCGVFNLESAYGSTEELFFVNHDLGGPYWKSEELRGLYDRFSPHRFVGNWKTPLLVIHGEKDFRVPVTQGIEAFTAAQVQGVPSRFLYFPNEGHWVLTPQNSVLWQRVFFDWLARYCRAATDGSQP